MTNSLVPSGYQLAALSKLVLNNMGGLLIADGVGVGKTISAGYILSYCVNRSELPNVVLCPPILVPKWSNELESKFRLDPRVVRSAEEFRTMKSELKFGRNPSSIYIMSSSMLLQTRLTDLPESNVLVMDEIHTWRNRDTKSHAAISALAKRALHRIGLSATPINNSLDDLVSEISLLLPQFDVNAIAEVVRQIWEQRDHSSLSPLITRFRKERLGIHFARRSIHWNINDYGSEYARWVRKAVGNVRGRPAAPNSYPMDTVTFFRLASSSPAAFAKAIGITPFVVDDPKIKSLLTLLDSVPDRVVLFCEFQETVKYLAARISRPAIVMTGETPQFERQALLEAFRREADALMIMSPVGGEGIDLQAASVLVNYDLNWNPMVLEQRIGRIDRRGQHKEEIQIHNFLTQGSIDERILRVMKNKLQISEGSLLENMPILESETENSLYDPATLGSENLKSSTLVDVVSQNEAIIEEDYKAAERLDLSFCDPSRLSKLPKGATPWISGKHASDWGALIQGLAAKLKERLEEFQSVV